MSKRYHQSLDYATPDEIYDQACRPHYPFQESLYLLDPLIPIHLFGKWAESLFILMIRISLSIITREGLMFFHIFHGSAKACSTTCLSSAP